MSRAGGEGIRLADLSAGYGGNDIVRDVTLAATASRVTTIVGPNGAGKSTLIKAVAGLLRPSKGKLFIGEKDITALAPAQRAAAGLGYVPQEHNVFKALSIDENLRIGFEFIRRRGGAAELRDARERVLTIFPDLGGRLNQIAGTLSGGQRQMLALASTLMPSPTALILDEPSAGLSPRYVRSMLDAVRAVNRAGVTVLMIEQNVTEALRISDDVVLLVRGQVRGAWPAGTFLDDPDVRSLFFHGRSDHDSQASGKERHHDASAA